ncbi:MAG: hypothetical protein NT003_03830 [Candidatus Magasanikbacteria bacterium]|nr:hypothetical protein [Candidatus Magasanikbacteria bacterium]
MKNPLEIQPQTSGKTKWHRLWAVAEYATPFVVGAVFVFFFRRSEMFRADTGTFVLLLAPPLFSCLTVISAVFWLKLKVAKLDNAVTIPPREQWGWRTFYKRVDNRILEATPGLYDLRDTSILDVPMGRVLILTYKFELYPENPLDGCQLVPWNLFLNFEGATCDEIARFIAVYEIAVAMGVRYHKVVLDPLRDEYYGKKFFVECVPALHRPNESF